MSVKHLYHCYPVIPCILVVKHGDKVNGMSIAWHSPLSFSPPLYGVLISPKRYTYELLVKAKDFTINFVDYKSAKLLAIMGRISGRTRDKIKDFNIELSNSKKVNSPYLKDAYAVYECIKERQVITGDHILFIGEIVEVHEREKTFDEEGLPNLNELKPALYLGKDRYFTLKEIEEPKLILPE
ncbi:MAG: flavin reductase family protein [Candidatus Hydrothermales bacterium]